MSESFFAIERLTELTNWMRGNPRQTRFEKIGQRLQDDSSFARIQHFKSALLSGALPDAKTLEFIVLSFDRYIAEEGNLSLDEAFSLRSRPKAGNQARQYAERNKMTGLLFDMATLKAKAPRLSIQKAAEMALGDDESIPVATLQREYTRRKCRNWLGPNQGK